MPDKIDKAFKDAEFALNLVIGTIAVIDIIGFIIMIIAGII